MDLSKVFSNYNNVACNTGNVFITGNPMMGAEKCVLQAMGDMFGEGNPIFYFDANLSRRRREELCSKALTAGYKINDISPKAVNCEAFDFLQLFAGGENKKIDAEQQAEAAFSFLYIKGDGPSFIERAINVLKDGILCLQARSGHSRIKDLFKLTLDEIIEELDGIDSLSTVEAYDEISFLKTEDAALAWGLINDRAKKLDACVVFDKLSGEKPAVNVFNGKVFTIISKSADSDDVVRRYDSLMGGFFSVLKNLGDERSRIGKPYHIFVYGADKSDSTNMNRLLMTTRESEFRFPMCVYEESMYSLFSHQPQEILAYFSAFLVFNTADGEFWSEKFGTNLMPDRTETYSYSRFGVPVMMTGGVVERMPAKRTGAAVHRTEKPLFQAREFDQLSAKQVIFHNVYEKRKRKIQID